GVRRRLHVAVDAARDSVGADRKSHADASRAVGDPSALRLGAAAELLRAWLDDGDSGRAERGDRDPCPLLRASRRARAGRRRAGARRGALSLRRSVLRLSVHAGLGACAGGARYVPRRLAEAERGGGPEARRRSHAGRLSLRTGRSGILIWHLRAAPTFRT